jgi:cytoskeleton protein RodZ
MILRKLKESRVLRVIMTNFGASFKKARESRGISLVQIASETRISSRFLTAIENEEFNLLPGGIFNRGFVRTYAQKVGLDPDQAVADYERLSEGQQAPEALTAAATPPAQKDHRLYPIAVGALILVIAIFYLVVNRESSQIAPAANVPPPPSVVQPAQPVQQPVPPPQQPAIPDAPPKTTSAAPEPVPQASAAAATPVKAPTAAPTGQALTIEIEATAQTWIKIVADGNTVNPGEILEPGMTRKFTAQNQMDISIGNAAGVNLKVNDKAAKPLGTSGKVRELSITPANIKGFLL